MNRRTTFVVSLASALALSAGSIAGADEGMWLMNQPPTGMLKEKYGFEPTGEWLEKMQHACVRFETGGSGSIVSAEGLVMTNHHVGSDMLSKLSTAESNLLEKGFAAKTRDQELACPDLELRVLWRIVDVTERVRAAVPADATPDKAAEARRAVIAEIERDPQQKEGLTNQVVTLYQGGKYHLYQYRAYTDIRLVFAPEEGIAFFGGDTDNFEFPRYDLDCCFFRIYEDGKPLQTPEHLKWSDGGCKEGELVFVFGNPGNTKRGYTTQHVRFLRDVDLPLKLKWMHRAEVKWKVFCGRDAEHARVGRDDLFGIQNGRKVQTGLLAGLQDPRLIETKAAKEQALRSAVAANPALSAETGTAWEDLETALGDYQSHFESKMVVDRFLTSGLLGKATMIVRLIEENAKPDGERLPQYRESHRESLLLALYSPEPVSAIYEEELLTQGLSGLVEQFGADDMAETLAGVGPAERARQLIGGTKLADPAVRRALVDGGSAALEASNDPLIQLAMEGNGHWRPMNKWYEDEVEAVERAAYTKIAAARFAIDGDKAYPDATFTLRMSYGTVKGIPGEQVPAFTDFAGLYRRYEERKGQEGFALPEKWLAAKGKLTPSTPYNFICDTDIIGGNSGSPIVNTKGEVVGLVFDGNVHSLVGNVAFDPVSARTVAVDSRGMIEALTKVYGAEWLVKEMGR